MEIIFFYYGCIHHKQYHASLCIHCHGHNVANEYPMNQLIEYTNNEEGLLLKDGVVKVGFVGQWNILLMKAKILVKTSWTMSHVFELGLQHEWCEFDFVGCPSIKILKKVWLYKWF